MQTFSNLRRSFFDNQFIALICAIFALILSSFLASKFIVISLVAISYLAFSHYMKTKNVKFVAMSLLVQSFFSINLGLWIFEIPVFLTIYYLIITNFLTSFSFPEKYANLIHAAIIYCSFFILYSIFDSMDFHIFTIWILNFLLEIFIIWAFL